MEAFLTKVVFILSASISTYILVLQVTNLVKYKNLNGASTTRKALIIGSVMILIASIAGLINCLWIIAICCLVGATQRLIIFTNTPLKDLLKDLLDRIKRIIARK